MHLAFNKMKKRRWSRKKKKAKVHSERKKPIAQKLTVPETEYILKWRLFYDKQIGDTMKNFTRRFLWWPEQHAVHPALLLKRQGLIIFIIPSEIPVSSLVLRKYGENHFIISYLKDLLVSVCEIYLSEPQIYPSFTCTYIMLVKKKPWRQMVTHTCIFNNVKEILVRRALKGFGELEVKKFSPVERERYLYSSKCYDQAMSTFFLWQTNGCRVIRHQRGSKPVGRS